MAKPEDLITDVRGAVYLVQRKSCGNGFFFAPCRHDDGIIVYSVESVQEVITTKPICLIKDEMLIRKLIGLHIRILAMPVASDDMVSAN